MTVLSRFRKPKQIAEVDWNAVYADHIGRIYNFFCYRVGNDTVAEDLCAATFEKAWRKRQQFRGDLDGFSAWLYTIARNVANDYFRQSRDLVSLDLLHGQATAEQSLPDTVQKRLAFQQIVTLIHDLPERERDIIALKYGAELNNRQIAKTLNLSESNVGSILYRTIRRLRQQLDGTHE